MVIRRQQTPVKRSSVKVGVGRIADKVDSKHLDLIFIVSFEVGDDAGPRDVVLTLPDDQIISLVKHVIFHL